jgi:GT2 family glycosyltransferase
MAGADQDLGTLVRVILVNYNAGAMLQTSIDALAAQSFQNFEVVIVDNNSSDNSARLLTLPDHRFQLLHAGANIGFAAGFNLGAAGAETPWIASLNPDAVPFPGWLHAFCQALERYPYAAAFGSLQLMHEDSSVLDGAGDCFSIFGLAWRGGYRQAVSPVLEDARVFSACGAAAFYRRDCFEGVEGFEDDYFCYMEDVDIGFRLNLKGLLTIQLRDAAVRHVGSAQSGRASAFTRYYGARNTLRTLVRCMPLPLVLLAIPMFLMSQVVLALTARQGLARARGILHGIARLPQDIRTRRAIQASRTVSLIEIARLLVWSPLTILRRGRHGLPPPPPHPTPDEP